MCCGILYIHVCAYRCAVVYYIYTCVHIGVLWYIIYIYMCVHIGVQSQGYQPEELNKKAVAITQRVKQKLTGD